MKKQSRFAPELTYLNAISCLLVVLIHVLSLGISRAEPTSWQLAVIYFPWRLAAFVVPAFLFSGGVKMAMAMEEQFRWGGYGRYIVSRFKKIYLPFLLWNVIYFLAFLRIGYVRGELGEFLSYLWTGSLSSPFYYVVIVMQFYLLQPLWHWLVKRIPWWSGLTCTLLLTLAAMRGNAVLGLFGLEFGWWDRVFPSYLVFWVAGLYAGKYYDRLVDALNGRGTALSGVMVLFFTVMAYLQKARAIYVFDLNTCKLFTDLLSILVVLWMGKTLAAGAGPLQSFLRYVSGASFFIYLSHCLFLTLGQHYMTVAGISNLTTLLAGRFIICYTGPFVLYELWRRVRRIEWRVKR